MTTPFPGSGPLRRGLALLALVTLVSQSAPAQQVRSKPPPTPPLPPVILPLERTQYFLGEAVLLAVTRAPRPYQLQWVDAADHAAVTYRGSQPLLRVRTDRLAPGRYQVVVDGKLSGVTVNLVRPQRASPAAFPRESRTVPQAADDRARLRQDLRETGVNALMALSWNEAGAGRYPAHDDLAATGTLLFLHPSTGLMSPYPARGYEPELRGFRQRLALCAQANGRYPTFGGFLYDRNPADFGDRSGLLSAGTWGAEGEALRRYLRRSFQAVQDDFTARTRLAPVSEAEYLRYCLALGSPELAPAIDLPTYRWALELGRALPPLSVAERELLGKRLDAWSAYLMSLPAASYAGHEAVLRDILPGLRSTSAVGTDAGAVRQGVYTPAAFAPLAFRYASAGTDRTGGSDYRFQALFNAALLDAGRRADQPVWVGSALGQAGYPGKLMRAAAHNLAYGGLGLGLALAAPETSWEHIKGQPAGEDLVSGRDFLKRFAALGAACGDVRRVGLLYSRTQLGRQHLVQGMDTPQFNAFVSLARLGYTPRLVTEEEILAGGLHGFKALVVVNQCWNLPDSVTAALEAFTAAGGRILIDRRSTVRLPGAEVVDVALPYKSLGLPHDWSVANLAGRPHPVLQDERHRQLAPALREGLGDGLRSALFSRLGATAKVSTFQLDGGPDATYVVAVNDAVGSAPADWVRVREELVSSRPVRWALYDLTAEQSLGTLAPLTCAFDDLTARVYGILREPVEAVDLAATQTVNAGGRLRVRVRFAGTDEQPLHAAIPFHLLLTRADGTTAQELYRCTDRAGEFSLVWRMPVNEAAGEWRVTVRSQLDGLTARLPVTVKAGAALEAEPVAEAVIVRGREAIRDLLKKKPTLILPVFENNTKVQLLTAAREIQDVLGVKGVRVELRPDAALSTYLMAYDPGRVEALQNLLAEKGETIGKIKVTTPGHHDYFAPRSGYVFGKPIILLDLVGAGANEMVARLDAEGLLWPRTGAAFPGPGRAVVQVVKSAFWPGQDALVIQAADRAGFQAAARALANLPEDWITPGIEKARGRLLSEFRIGTRGGQVLPGPRLTSQGLQTDRKPEPVALRFGAARPPTQGETQAPMPPLCVWTLPAEIDPREARPVYLVDGKPVETVPVRFGDTRYHDGLLVRVGAREGGAYQVAVHGTFRYSDRRPRAQPDWETWLALDYSQVRHPRRPMTYEVWVDRKMVGRLAPAGQETRRVPVETLPPSSPETPRSVREEVVTRLAGTVALPAGPHDVLLIPRNVVDGQVDRITLDVKH